MKKVLLIEDDISIIDFYQSALRKNGGVQVIIATTLEEAEKLFFANKESLDAIVIVACLRSGLPNTTTLLKEVIRPNFEGKIIAVSGSPFYRQDLLDSGADYEMDKNEVPKFLSKQIF